MKPTPGENMDRIHMLIRNTESATFEPGLKAAINAMDCLVAAENQLRRVKTDLCKAMANHGRNRPESERNVHTEHCCKWHGGCKYGDFDCPVVTGKQLQSFPCEDCVDSWGGSTSDDS